jgi:predicted membrane-bound mannosyltransferase
MLLDRTAADVFLLLDDIREVSRRQGDDAIPISLDDRIAQPVRWYLRQFLSVTVARTSAATKTPVVIIPAEAKDAMAKSLGRGYVNQRYRILSTWQPQAPIDRWLRWAHVREQVTPPQGEEIYAFYKLIQ